jgi:hypothetical protein
LRVEQLPVHAAHRLDLRRRQTHELREAPRKHVVRADMEPRLGRHLLLVAGGLRPVAELAFADQAQLVVVVEHHPAVARDAEVLQQHVAGEDVVARQVLDGLAIVERGAARSLGHLFAQVQVERAQPPLHVAQVQHHVLAVLADALRTGVAQFFQQRRRKPRAREAQVAVRLRVEQAADAVQVEHQRVLAFHVFARHALLSLAKRSRISLNTSG